MNNYVFPELPYYMEDWVPVLKIAKDLIERDEARFVCSAVSASVCMRGPRYTRANWTEAVSEIRGAISVALESQITVSSWYRLTFKKSISRFRSLDKQAKATKAYRLAWIDHIIMKCKGD